MATVRSVNASGDQRGNPSGNQSGDEGLPLGRAETFPKMYARTRRFSVGVPRNITMAGNNRVLFLRTKTGDDPVLCLWRLDTETSNSTILVDPTKLTTTDDELPAAELARRERARESASGIVSYSVDGNGAKVCFSLAGSLFVVDIATGAVTTPDVAGDVFDPRLSPDGSKVAYVSGSNLRVVELGDDGSDQSLTSAPSPTVSFGRAEFIAAEEMQRNRGFWWSPDSSQLLVTRVDEAPVPSWWIADPAHPDHEPNKVRYPAAGSANALVDLLLFNLDRSSQTIRWDDDGRFEYLANVVWPAGHEPLIVRQTRDQREVSIAALDLEDLSLTTKRTITDDIWVELIPSSPTVCDAGLLTIEDLAGESRSPGVPATGAAKPGRRALLLNGKALTGENLNVRSIIGVTGGLALVSAWTEPTEIHLFAVDVAGANDPTRLTVNPGVHTAVVGELIEDESKGAEPGDADPDRYSAAPLGPRVLAVVSSARPDSDGLEVAVRPLLLLGLQGGGSASAASTPALAAPLAFIEDLSERPPVKAAPHFHQLSADRLESALFLPSRYDGHTKLPVLLDPYGGPHAQRVLKTQTAHLVSQWFAEQGFAVLVTDGRGTPGRGPEWERQVWGDLASPVLEDQLAALDAAAHEFGILDLTKVAIRGWSFGGYLAALAVLRRPDRFHAAIAGAPVTDWRLYDTHYTERYLGRPDLYPRHYDTTDLSAEAASLERPLLLIHGLADDNVVAAHTLRLSTALLGAARPHQVLPLSGVTHMTPQEAVAENLLWLQLRFIQKSLGLTGPQKKETEKPSRTTVS